MVINLVRPVPTIKSKPVADQRGNDFAGGDVPKSSVVDIHRSDGDRDTRLDSHLYLIGWFLRNVLVVLKHALDHLMDNVIDFLERFGFRGTPG